MSELDFSGFDDSSEFDGFDPSGGVEGDGGSGEAEPAGPMNDDYAAGLLQRHEDRAAAREAESAAIAAKVRQLVDPEPEAPLFGDLATATADGFGRIAAAIANSPNASAMLDELREMMAEDKAAAGAEAEPVPDGADSPFDAMDSATVNALADYVLSRRSAFDPPPGHTVASWRALLRSSGAIQ